MTSSHINNPNHWRERAEVFTLTSIREDHMNKALAACLFSAVLLLPLAAHAQQSVARFDGGIGSQPVRAPATANDVNGVLPSSRPWVISRLTANVRSNGRIKVDGQGLVLAGGSNIGTSGGQAVRARLYCGGVPHDTLTVVPLEPNGDFRIDGVISPLPPSVCANPVLLILSAGGNWFAAGIPKE
jgi:hypothetical protein